ncbi:MAG TPA: septum site-determining protein Ssd [Nocardioidaceae bacterium]|nr:septum site-determining protein Ssd [Nocardioidaceae bacterium]
MSATALLITRDDLLLEEMLRLAAAAGVVLDVAHDPDSAALGWSGPATVLVGADLAAGVAARRPVRRDQVHVVAHGAAPDDLFRHALAIGATQVVELPDAETWMVELLTDTADGATSGSGLTLGVVGGCGGAGASTLAAALAVVPTSPEHPVTLIDADPLGGGLDQMVGLDGADGVRWDALVDAGGRFSSRSLREALPGRDGLSVLTWPVTPVDLGDGAATREVLSAAQRGSRLVVIDVPRHLDPVTEDLLGRCDHVVLVSGLSLPAVAAAGRVAARVSHVSRQVHLVTRGVGTGLGPDEVAAALGVPLLAAMADQRRLHEWIDLGLGPVHSRRGPLAKACRRVLDALDRPAPQRSAA